MTRDVQPSQQNTPARNSPWGNFPIGMLSFELKDFAPKPLSFDFSITTVHSLGIFYLSPAERTADHFPFFPGVWVSPMSAVKNK